MKNTGFLLAALAAFALAASSCGAAEDVMPLVPAAARPGEESAPLRKNNVRLTLPSLGRPAEGRMRVVEALPESGDGTLRFRESASGAGQVGIPGYVSPEVLALSRMEAERWRPAESPRPGFTPISLPATLGTEELEELMAFDPYSVQRTGNPFKDAPGAAAVFPLAVTENSNLHPPKAEDRALSLRPSSPPAPSSLKPPSSPAAVVATARLGGTRDSLPGSGRPSQFSAGTIEQPPLPELSVRTMTAGSSRRAAALAEMPAADSGPVPASAPAVPAGSALGITGGVGVTGGLRLPLPPMALADGGDVFAAPPPLTAGGGDGFAPRMAVGPSLRAGERILAPQTYMPAQEMPGAFPMAVPETAAMMPAAEVAPAAVRRPARNLPQVRAEEFVPMRGVSLLTVQ